MLVRRRDGDARAAVEARAPTTERLPPRAQRRRARAPRRARRRRRRRLARRVGVRAHRLRPTRVLRVPRSNPLAWQLSLVDRELDETLRCELASGRARTRGRTGDDARASRSLTALSREDENENETKTTADGETPADAATSARTSRVRSATSPWTTSTTTPRAPATPRTARWCGAAASDDRRRPRKTEDHRRTRTSRRRLSRRSRPDARDAGAACTRGASPCSATTASARTRRGRADVSPVPVPLG